MMIRHCLLIGAALFAGRAAAAGMTTDPSFLLAAEFRDLSAYFPTYLANGYVSTFSTRRGTEGAPAYLVAFMDDDPDDVSRPAVVPGWTEVDYSTGPTISGQSWLNKAPLDADHFQEYRQTLDLQSATLTTSYRYVEAGKAARMEVTTFVSAAAPHLAATRLAISPEFDGIVDLSFALNLWAPHAPRLALARITGPQMEEEIAANGLTMEAGFPARTDRAAFWYPGDTHVLEAHGDTAALTLQLAGRAEQGLAMAEAAAIALPVGLTPQDVRVYQSPFRLALNLKLRLQRGRTYVFSKYVALSREHWGGGADEDLRLAAAARATGFDVLQQDHAQVWKGLWQSDIVIEGDPQAQRAVHSELYYLLATSTANTGWPLGACGMTPGYTGHVFWDSDTWVFPALLLLHPERAKSLVEFRDRTLAAAQARAAARGFDGAMYPWEADPERGTEQTPHFAEVLGEREIHVNSDVAVAQWQYYLATLDLNWLRSEGWPVIRAVARFWASRASYDPKHHRYEILHVTSVDEAYSDVPNDTFTNLGAARALRIATTAARAVGERPDPRWGRIAAGLYVPFDPAGAHHLEFDPSLTAHPEGWGGSALPLLYLPALDLPIDAALRRADYEFAVRPHPLSMAAPISMALPPRSTAAASIGDAAAAAAWFGANFTGGTLKAPFNVRTETADNNTGYFVTGSAGFLQNLLFGFSGLRIRDEGLVQAYAPVLPPSWQSMTLQNLTFRGKHLDVRISRAADGQTVLSRQDR
jgi:trehalose/maltose hydrolase-like predicted phosphorylase